LERSPEMFEKLLAALLLQLIEKAGPILIEIILKWLQGLSDQERNVALDTLIQMMDKKAA